MASLPQRKIQPGEGWTRGSSVAPAETLKQKRSGGGSPEPPRVHPSPHSCFCVSVGATDGKPSSKKDPAGRRMDPGILRSSSRNPKAETERRRISRTSPGPSFAPFLFLCFCWGYGWQAFLKERSSRAKDGPGDPP